MGGLLSPLGDALLGQDLAQPSMLVGHVPSPSCSSACLFQRPRSAVVVAGQLSMALRRVPRIRHLPYANVRRFPIFGRWLLTAAVSLRLVTRDNPGEMGGRVASPTFVGRLGELELLEAARGRAADGEPAVVLVGGEAGVGKTRLVTELAARCATDGTRVLQGGCVPVGDGALPYAPIVEALRSLLADVGAGAVRELVGPSWPELAHLLPALGEPEAGGPPSQATQARLFELLLSLLGRLSEQTPLVLVVEDLHWADRSTRDLLAFLVRNLRRERLLLVVIYRNDEPGQQRLGPYLAELDRGGQIVRIELARLDQAETVAQLVGILGAVPAADLVDGVFARSEGNPFFTEELLEVVRSGSGELPATLRDLLRGRVQTLPDPARQVLAVIAVAGRRISHRLLASVAGLDDRELVEALRVAVANHLLVTAPGEDGYEFRHALLREVVGADLLPGERTRLHASCAQALTDQPKLDDAAPAVLAGELAVHWDAADELARALPARVQAGLTAGRARAFAEAHRHYERALELWELVPESAWPMGLDQVDLLARTAEAAAFTGAVERAIRLVGDALDRVDPAVEPVRAAVLLARLGDHRWVAGDEAGALAAFEQAERLLAGKPPSAERARVLAAHAYALLLSLRSEEARLRCEEAITVARAVGARAEEARGLRVLAGCLGSLGDEERAIALGLEARNIAEEVGDAETVMSTYVIVDSSLGLLGRERDALDDAQQGYQRARDLGLEHAMGSYVAVNVVNSLLDLGRWVECERLARELLAGDTWDAFGRHRALGLLLARRGEFAEAREHLHLAQRLSPSFFGGSTWWGPVELALWEGRDDEAGAAVAEGLRWCAERDPDGTLLQRTSRWYALALRLEADRVERAAARRAPEEVAAARRRAAPVLTTLDRLAAAPTPQARSPWIIGQLLLSRAEQSRLEGRSDPERWQAATAAWERLEHPFEAAYARYRQAEALLAGGAFHKQAETVLRAAHQTAVTLGAKPLRREIGLLAQRGRLHLQEPVDAATEPKAPPSPAASLGLTRRETEVLVLVAAGRTNRQIGQALFITPKTASVHVSRILAKLGVAGRGEAAAIAHRLGLDKQ
jgi:DNA-binding CsgD family transcriptional regulator/tetratricopeptide (TPR) repeat protein